jgi:hypothetical protein
VHFDVTNPPHIHCWFDFDWRYLPFSLKLWCCVWPHLRASNYINEWKTSSKVIFRFDIDVTSSWWRPWTAKGARSSWSWPHRAWYYHILQILSLWWFCCKSTLLLVMKIVMRRKTPPSSHGFQFSALDTIVGCVVWFTDYLLITK